MSRENSLSSEETPDPPSTISLFELTSPYPPHMEADVPDITSDIDEVPDQSSDEWDEKALTPTIVDSRTPAAPPVLENPPFRGDEKLQNGFDIVLGVLEHMGPLKFAAAVFGPNLSGLFICNFRLDGEMDDCSWECGKTLTELRRLGEKLQRDKNLRGLGTSVPPLPEKKHHSVITDQEAVVQRDMVTEFVRAMFTNVVFLGYPSVLNTFDVPGIVRTKIDTFAKLYQTPLLSTYLNKEGGKIKNWKRRWVVLYPDFTLRYYDSQNEETGGGKGFRGMVDIQALNKIYHHKIDEKHFFVLILKYRWQEKDHPREYKFETSDSSVQNTWLRAVTLLRDGDLSKYIPEVTELDAGTRNSLEAMRSRKSPSSVILEQEKLSNIKLLAKLGEMRVEQDNFNANDRVEREEFAREQQKLEDDWNDLRPNLEDAKKALGLGQESIQLLKRDLKAETARWEKRMEEAEEKVRTERLKYNLRTGIKPLPIMPKPKKRKNTIVENTAPFAFGDQLDMYTSPTVMRRRDIWFVMIDGNPYLEWTDLSEGLDAPSATRMHIAKVEQEDDSHSFTVRSAKKNKKVTLVTTSAEDCKKWVRTINNGLGVFPDDSYEEKEEVKSEVVNCDLFAVDIDSGDLFPANYCDYYARKNGAPNPNCDVGDIPKSDNLVLVGQKFG